MSAQRADVVVVGAGPAGWSAAYACAARGLDTLLVAPRPDAVWGATYGVWADQRAALPAGAETVLAGRVRGAGREMGRGYAVLDNDSVMAAYLRGGVRLLRGSVVGATLDVGAVSVVTRSGEQVTAGVIVDASGPSRVLSGGALQGPRAEQTAYGAIVPAAAASGLVGAGEAIFMDWGGAVDGCATFLYAVPLPGDRVLLEETSLAARPGIPLDVLAGRLAARLASSGFRLTDAVATERVRFALDAPIPSPVPGVVAYGVAGGMMHPATGFSVGDSMTTAPVLAAAIAEALPRGPAATSRAAREAVWPAAARQVRRLRDLGLRTLLRMPANAVPEFFDAFFSLSAQQQRSYLSGRSDLGGTAAAMTAVFAGAPWHVRASMLRAQVRASGAGGRSPAGAARTPGC